jgi:hypothetical protein
MRDECTKLSAGQFLTHEDYKELQIWDLKYLSTSDEEDEDFSDSEEEEDDSDESDEEEAAAKKKRKE